MKKYRHFLIFILFLLSLGASGQPAETTYQGILIANGPLNPLPVTADGPYPIGFTFTFYGNSYTDFWMSENGRIHFTNPSSPYSDESTIPTAALPNNYIAPFWDNLTVDGTGNLLYTTIGAAPNRKLIVQYKNMMFYSPTTFMGTFSVILYETSNNIQFQYRQLVDYTSLQAHGSSATIGIENSDGTIGALYAFHNPTAITSGQAILLSPGSPYTINSNAIYDGVYLTKTLSAPEPGITSLLSPAQDAVVGTDFTFQWGASSNAVSYSLLISENSGLGGAVPINTGANLSYNVTGLIPGRTYYWGVFAINPTGTTWCEIKKFTTSSAPPLAAVPQTAWLEQNQEKTINLAYTGGDASPKTAIINTLPANGKLYQYNAGVKGAEILTPPVTVTDPGRNVIYTATGGSGNGIGNFSFKINDINGDSPDALVTVNVSPPGIPNVLYLAKNTSSVEIQFDIQMANPAGKENEFTVKSNGLTVPITSAALKTGDPNTIVLTSGSPITDPVLISYAQGTVTSAPGGVLLSFTDLPVTLTSQTIDFPQSLDLKYNNSPVTLTATASSGLSVTYTSSNLSVATVSGNILTFIVPGTSEITARQTGTATYATVKHAKTLTVGKAEQVITFTLPAKTYGDADFNLTATSGSGLPVSYASNNPAVATVTGTLVHIAGAGTAVITATQAGNTYWNSAPPVAQTLTVNKATLTVTADSKTKVYGAANPALTFIYTGWVRGVETIDTPPIASTTVNLTTSVGIHTGVITVAGGLDNNYAFNFIPADFTISKSNLTFTAENKSRGYLVQNPVLTYIMSGFMNGETQSVLDVLPAIQTTALQNSSAGSYPITLTGGNDNNYNYLYVAGTLTVTKIAQTITFSGVPVKLRVQESYTLVATSTSGFAVLFESMDPQKATVTGALLTGVSKGNVQIRAYHPGDQNYNPAEVLATVKIYSNHDNIKNLFTPNSDGINDLWELPELEEWGKCDVKVYNRWGNLVFADGDYNNLWDGTSKGSPLPEGAYYFVIKTQNAGTVTGTVNIVR